MADWNLPGLTDLYTNVLTYLKNRLNDVVTMLDSTLATPTNLPTGAKRWNSTTNKWEKWTGSAWTDMADTYAISISGNAATATTATTATALSGTITESQVTNLATDLAAKAPLASPTFTGTVTAPTFSGNLSGNATSAGNADTLDSQHASYFQPASTAITTSNIGSQYVAGFTGASGSAPQFACRAWVHFNGTNGSIYASGNVASVTRTAGATYVITFATPMPDTNYAIIGIGTNVGSFGTLVFENINGVAPRTTSSVTVYTVSNNGATFVEDHRVSVVIFR